MPTSIAASHRAFSFCSVVLSVLVSAGSVHAATFSTLYSFTGPPGDGGNPLSSLVADKAGNLYGTTAVGGSTDMCSGYQPVGCGTAFRLAPDGSETVLHAFSGQPDGAYPHAGLVADRNGNLYGTTSSGGAWTAANPPPVSSTGRARCTALLRQAARILAGMAMGTARSLRWI